MSARAPRPPAELSIARRYAIAWLVAILVTAAYLTVGHLMAPFARDGAIGTIDGWIPYVPWTVWLYLPMYILVFHTAVFVIRTRRTLNRTILSLFIASAMTFTVFVLWPHKAPRVPIGGIDDWNMWLFRGLQAIDPPNNTFPSLHVASLLCVGLGCYRDDRRGGTAVIALSLFPIMATLTTKQHYAADLVGGAAVAALSHWAAFAFELRTARRTARVPDRAGAEL
jgi:PAP2 superfamily protein